MLLENPARKNNSINNVVISYPFIMHFHFTYALLDLNFKRIYVFFNKTLLT